MAKKKGTVKEVSAADLRRRLGKKPVDDDDRRGSARLDTRLEVEVPLASWDQFRSVYTKNLSKGGLLFTVPAPAKIPGELTLTLALPDGRKITLPAEVRHVAPAEGVKEYDVGVQFGALAEESQQLLDQAYAGLSRAKTSG